MLQAINASPAVKTKYAPDFDFKRPRFYPVLGPVIPKEKQMAFVSRLRKSGCLAESLSKRNDLELMPVVQAMQCASCHDGVGRRLLRPDQLQFIIKGHVEWIPSEAKKVSEFARAAIMPPGSQLNMSERTSVVSCLTQTFWQDVKLQLSPWVDESPVKIH